MNVTKGNRSRDKSSQGFTIVDLVAVTAILALLAGLLLPALSATQNASHGMFCVSNKKQLILAFSTYAADNDGRFIGNLNPAGDGSQDAGMFAANMAKAPWILGWLDWKDTQANTNTLYLTHPKFARLSPYLGYKATVFKCPSDVYLSDVQRKSGRGERVRSISANFGVGDGNAESGPWDSYFTHVKKFSDMMKPAPSDVWVYTDEHPDSINDCGFFNPLVSQWIDLPASYHDGAGSFAFADGSAALHKWQASAKNAKITAFALQYPSIKSSKDADIIWMRTHASHK